MHDAARYSRKLIASLIDGGFMHPDTGAWVDSSQWMELRSYFERTGDLDSENVATVIDFERALTALQQHHPNAACVVACVTLLDFDGADLNRVLGGRTNWARLQNKAVAWMSSYLSGLPVESTDDSPSCERSYKRAM